MKRLIITAISTIIAATLQAQNVKKDIPGLYCFAANTQISITETTTRDIQEIKKGDLILAYDPDTKQTFQSEVMSTAAAPHNNIVCYTFDDGSHITTTDDHPFLTTSGWASSNPQKTAAYKGFEPIIEITTSCQIITPDGTTKQIVAITKPTTPKIKTYTIIKLEKGYTFFANGCAVGTEEPK